MWTFDLQGFISAFIVLFAIIDVTGSLPVFVDLQTKNKNFSPLKASFFSLLILLGFFFIGEGILRLFNIDVSSFAVAGAIVLFVIGCEMTFGVEIFKMDGQSDNATIIPVIFPMLAGPGAFTALLSLKAEYSWLDIILALVFNMLIVYMVLRKVHLVEKLIGKGGIFVLRKFFGVILLAIAMKLFVTNISLILN